MRQTECSTIQQLMEQHINDNGKNIRNKAAFGALLKIIPALGDGLYHALTAGEKAISDEKVQTQLTLLCTLVEKIDAAISEMLSDADERGVPFINISGKIEVFGENATRVTGLDASSGRSVSVSPGTCIQVVAKNSESVIGVKI